MRSSYRNNQYGALFEALILIHRPKIVVECGILDGYSLLHMAVAASVSDTKIYAFDLFEDYQFKHGKKEEVEDIIATIPSANVEVVKEDALKAYARFEDESVGFLHVDISNDGDMLRKALDVWHPKIAKDGILVFEGGSEERDKVEWMVNHRKKPISYFKSACLTDNYEFVTLTPFPSLTVCRKK